MTVPFTSFANPPWAEKGDLTLRSVTELAIYVGGETGGQHTITIDSVTAHKA